jgi:hypothetical protein
MLAFLLLLPSIALAQAVIPPSSSGGSVADADDGYVQGSFGIGTANPGQKLHMVGGNFLFDGTGELSMLYKRGGTYGPDTDPIFAFGRIVNGGTGKPTFRILYSAAAVSETDVLMMDSSGIIIAGNYFRGAGLGNAASPQTQGFWFFGSSTMVTAAGDGASIYLQSNSGAAFALFDINGMKLNAGTLGTCNAGLEGKVTLISAAGAVRTHMCLCTSDGAGTPAFAWQNMATGTVATASTCTP